jgi:hypothetical protein
MMINQPLKTVRMLAAYSAMNYSAMPGGLAAFGIRELGS